MPGRASLLQAARQAPVGAASRRCVTAAPHRQMVMKEMSHWLKHVSSGSWACLESKQNQCGRGHRGHAFTQRSGGSRRTDCHGEDWRLRRKKPGFLHLAKQVGIGQEGILGQDVEVGEESEGFVEMESSLWRWRSLSRSLRTSKLSTASAAKSCASRDSLRRGSCDQSRTA